MADPIRYLEARVSTLEAQIKFLLRLNGMDVSALREAPDEELLRYYRDAIELMGVEAKKLPPETMERWAELFLQLSEIEFVRLQGLLDYDHTWEPFYQLCIRLMTSLRQNPNLITDPTLKGLYSLLERARKNLRDGAVVMSRKYPETLLPLAKAILQDTP